METAFDFRSESESQIEAWSVGLYKLFSKIDLQDCRRRRFSRCLLVKNGELETLLTFSVEGQAADMCQSRVDFSIRPSIEYSM
jgi:hypothetical protein